MGHIGFARTKECKYLSHTTSYSGHTNVMSFQLGTFSISQREIGRETKGVGCQRLTMVLIEKSPKSDFATKTKFDPHYICSHNVPKLTKEAAQLSSPTLLSRRPQSTGEKRGLPSPRGPFRNLSQSKRPLLRCSALHQSFGRTDGQPRG